MPKTEDNVTPPRKKTQALRPGLALFGALLFSAVTAGGVDLILCAMRLRDEGVETTGRVVEVGPGGYRGHWVRYHFSVGDDPRTYSATDALRLQLDIGAKVPPGEWERARATGWIRVRYVPSNPWINLPAEAPPFFENPWVSGVVSAILGFFALLNWAVFAGLVIHRRQLRATGLDSPPRNEVKRLVK